ncbi:MAG: aspartate aminotransferase family protein, partial [bacterium]
RHKNGNDFNERLINTLNESGKMYLTHTRLNDQFIIRFSVGQTTTTLNHLKKSWDYILDTVNEMEKG